MTASAPVMMTKAMIAKLLASGYTQAEIDNMNPSQAWALPVWLEAAGGRFCKVTAWNDPGDSPGKNAKVGGKDWQDKPLTWAQVRDHVKRGGNIGLICGQHSGGLILLDIDDNLPGFLSSFPEFENYPRIERGHPGKAKFIIQLTGEYTGTKKFKKKPQDKPHTEILATGNQGVIPPSIHPEGGRYEYINPWADIPTMAPEDLASIAARWHDLQAPNPGEWEPPLTDWTQNAPGHNTDLREEVRAAWPPLRVFGFFNLAQNGTKKEGEWIRVLGNGGLFVRDNHRTWALTGSGKGAGGDCFDAWHFCETNGREYKLPAAQFRETLHKMARAAGIAIPDKHPAKKADTVHLENTYLHNQTDTTQAPVFSVGNDFLDYCLNRGETGDSELFSALYSDRVKYDWLERKFYTWQGSCWAPELPGETVRMVHTMADKYLTKGAELLRAGDERHKPYLKRASHLMALSRINNVLTLAQAQENIGLTGKEWEIDPMLLPVANGVIDLNTGAFRQTSPADLIRTHAPIEWRGINEPAPIWEKTLLEIFGGDPDLVSFARRLIGYMVTGLTNEQIIAIFYGSGSNGKSLFVAVLAAVLGADFVFPTQAEALMEAKYSDGNTASPYVYAMRGKRLVLASEGKEGQKLNTGLVKQLTGDSLITARQLFGNPVTFKQTHKIILITNHLPSIPDSEDFAIWRRIMPLPFSVQFIENPTQPNERKINRNLAELLKAEYSGILAWCVRGCLEWQAQGLAAPAAVLQATEQYKDAEDPIAQFIDECLTADPAREVLASAAFNQYNAWCKDNGVLAIGSKTFYARLKRKFGDPVRKKTGIYYQNVGLIL